MVPLWVRLFPTMIENRRDRSLLSRYCCGSVKYLNEIVSPHITKECTFTGFIAQADFIYAVPEAWLSVPFAFLGQPRLSATSTAESLTVFPFKDSSPKLAAAFRLRDAVSTRSHVVNSVSYLSQWASRKPTKLSSLARRRKRRNCLSADSTSKTTSILVRDSPCIS